jgi:uncharacterized protein YcbK (DUF882 family)
MNPCKLRRALLTGARVGLAGLALPLAARAASPHRGAAPAPARLAFVHTHTGETLDLVYRQQGQYLTDAMQRIDRLLRDHRTGDIHPVDPALLDLLAGVSDQLGAGSRAFHVISGYRSPATNGMLNARGSGVARQSLHLSGKAIDVRIPGISLARLRDVAQSMKAGGVGFYPKSDFVHLDTGRVRSWSG